MHIGFHICIIITLACMIYSFTVYGRRLTNKVTAVDTDVKVSTEKCMKDIEHKFKTRELNSCNTIKDVFTSAMSTYPFIDSMYMFSHSYPSVIATRTNDNIVFTQVPYQTEMFTRMYPQWFTKELSQPKWSNPYYTSKESDRGYEVHYTSNVLSLENGGVDAILNITCKSKLRKRSDILS